MENITKPQQVMAFAKEYESLYREYTQYKSAYEILAKERDELKRALEIERNSNHLEEK